MKVSLSWLNEYVPITMEVSELADALTMAGLEVEAVEDRYAFLETVVVGKVTEVLPHPNADRLKLCRVDSGGKAATVVCGAPNVAVGIKAPLAHVGTRLPNGAVLQETVIRGETSAGMLCSERELELGSDGSGLMVLDPDLQPGLCLKDALNLSDFTLEIGLTPNRPDCLSLIGVAREIAAILGVALNVPEFSLPDSHGNINDLTSVTIEATDHCPRYAARLLEGVSVAPSPYWLQERLRSVGVRPINNLVDVTNFVMLETGQPLHAFDFDNLAGHRIVVRTAAEGEPFTTLDNKDRLLSDQMLMICDGEKPVAVGGVMGGLNSEIEDTTTRVLIESACFDPISIRKTSKSLGLNTDASHRFERGVDPDGTLFALDRAAGLMAELGLGRMVAGFIDEDFRSAEPLELSLSVPATNDLLGTDLDRDVMAKLLESVAFQVRPDGDQILRVQVPSFRVDVFRPQDLMEEVARLSGYNRIPVTFPQIPARGASVTALRDHRNRVREILCAFGFSETINYSFISAESADRIQLDAEDPRRSHVDLLNPISEEQSVMRTTLVPGMLETAQRNIARQQNDLRLFEVGKVFLPQPDMTLPLEKEMLVGLWTGARSNTAWHTRETACDFYDIKGAVQGLALCLGVGQPAFTAQPDEVCRYTRAGHTAKVLLDGEMLGIVGELDTAVVEHYNLKQRCFVFELDLELLSQRVPDSKQMVPIPRFPSTSRDITVIVDQAVESSSLMDTVVGFGEALVEDLYLFDVFAGDPIPVGKKSVSFRIVYRSAERTLEDETVNEIHHRLTQQLITEFRATLPA
ncbi:phenylalanine--tRNA ligase beta subunit [Desulfosarcina widdelii]|uniref:Phenylalanine--tRNA ligase beta subunit n=1 Tax=Desulfosarcina widdelii TaxID=947919 RepID=A0A5K7Z3Y4_9BACT|nr:phenylalanine--tRNA ligase subunit beta [Desulfosarcina widdelii]BBO76466.1 phenylalanine--tRNA ligase beta subunit [Desulfosarcina widdelii]